MDEVVGAMLMSEPEVSWLKLTQKAIIWKYLTLSVNSSTIGKMISQVLIQWQIERLTAGATTGLLKIFWPDSSFIPSALD